ncbi:MAG TPA: bifunctional adenosylcobinamide kinase/adenosylcobinamide-phosphate guanylyltransferase [Candidatus Limnocylindrales bacterium]|nr:bifunctional adenosylcobinamide kinase/adenosylcobinamide-phosphate guanylyltransferase [Candidatus Limnocylindrales bacterium]
MRIDVLGTGSADRWPNPWCACDRCQWARDAGVHRDRTSALVNGRLLIDPGPDAGSGGIDLTGVRTVLITHDHPDHLDPAFLLAWSWASGPGLLVAGPADAVERCRDWVGPQAPVEFRELAAGDELTLDGADGELRIRALPAAHSTAGGLEHDGTALLFEVAATDATLLYATDTATLPHETLSGPYDVVLLELTFGDTTDHGTAHLDLPAFGREVARLRANGRLADGARVVAVHLSHHNPIDLSQRLVAIGAEVVRDGTALQVGTAGRRVGRRLLVTGGARSGKSHHAESLVRGRVPVTYVATAPTYPDDPEWVERITRHRHRRPPTWRLRETAQVADMLRETEPAETVLVDCLTLWVTAAVDRANAWEDPSAAESAVEAVLADLLDAMGTTQADVVLVTNEVGSGIAPATASGRLFRDLLGRVNTAVAAACDDVVLVTSGIPRTLKGRSWTTST